MAQLLHKKRVTKVAGVVIRDADVNSVMIGFEDDPNSFRKIPRHRVTVEDLRVSMQVDVEHLRDENGAVFWPKQWEDELFPPPFKYFIYIKVPRELEDDAAESAEWVQ